MLQKDRVQLRIQTYLMHVLLSFIISRFSIFDKPAVQHMIGTLASLRACHAGAKNVIEIWLSPFISRLVGSNHERMLHQTISLHQRMPGSFKLLWCKHMVYQLVEISSKRRVSSVDMRQHLFCFAQNMPLAPSVVGRFKRFPYCNCHREALVCNRKSKVKCCC